MIGSGLKLTVKLPTQSHFPSLVMVTVSDVEVVGLTVIVIPV